MSFFLWLLLIYWVACAAAAFIIDLKELGLEEEGIFDNIVYYVLLVPFLILIEMIAGLFRLLRRKLQ